MNDIQKSLLDEFQRDMPLTARPYQAMADRLGISEDEVIETLTKLSENGVLSRVGAVIRPGTVGHSTLAAMSVPADRLESVAALISSFDAVNHNYEREHNLNLWFVIAAADRQEVDLVIEKIEHLTGIKVLNLPMLEDYHLDLGFDLKWT
jgi:siroheme decarboxylase